MLVTPESDKNEYNYFLIIENRLIAIVSYTQIIDFCKLFYQIWV